MLEYDKWLYKLTPIRETEPGWYKLRWRPIRNGTWHFYKCKAWPRKWSLGIKIYRGGAHNGWGRAWEDLNIQICFGRLGMIEAWIVWNIRVMGEGPGDVAEAQRRPLDLSRVRTRLT